jgi:hypothetical protein
MRRAMWGLIYSVLPEHEPLLCITTALHEDQKLLIIVIQMNAVQFFTFATEYLLKV